MLVTMNNLYPSQGMMQITKDSLLVLADLTSQTCFFFFFFTSMPLSSMYNKCDSFHGERGEFKTQPQVQWLCIYFGFVSCNNNKLCVSQQLCLSKGKMNLYQYDASFHVSTSIIFFYFPLLMCAVQECVEKCLLLNWII